MEQKAIDKALVGKIVLHLKKEILPISTEEIVRPPFKIMVRKVIDSNTSKKNNVKRCRNSEKV